MTGLDADVRAFVADGAGLEPRLVLPGNAPVPRPADLYATALLVEDRRRGFPVTSPDGDRAIVSTPRAAAYSVQFYRPGAVAAARRLTDWAESPDGLAAAALAGFQVDFPLTLRRLDLIVGDGFEERAQIDLTVHYVRARAAPDGPALAAAAGRVRISGPGTAIEEAVNG